MLETDAMIGPGICRCFAQPWNSRRTKSPNPKKRAILGDTPETASIVSNYTWPWRRVFGKGNRRTSQRAAQRNGEERMNRRARLRGYMMASSHLHSSLKAIHCIGIVAIPEKERGASLFAKIPIRRIGFPSKKEFEAE